MFIVRPFYLYIHLCIRINYDDDANRSHVLILAVAVSQFKSEAGKIFFRKKVKDKKIY